ncbi:MAG: prolipoprotein diacylglyceryl transferase [Candidatus Omnitrophica bacterium]|nr:prolipoprotein diacylglyceryl transferase [Candidatus Omnitrophota bacterium]
MHRVLIQIGPFAVYSYGFFMAAAFLICVFLVRRNSDRFGVPSDKVMDCLVWLLIGGVVGGRLLFALINWHYYFQHPVRIFALREGGMAFQGSLAMAVLAGALACRLKRIPFWRTGDFVAPYAALGHAVGRIGCFFNGCCYGRIIEKGLGVTFPGEPYMRIPTQIYSALFLLFLYLFLAGLREKKVFGGFVLSMYIIAYSAFRFFMGFLRGDTPAVLWGMKLSQLISAGMLVSGAALLLILHLRKHEGT